MAQSLYGKFDYGRGLYSAVTYAAGRAVAGAAFDAVAAGQRVLPSAGLATAAFDAVASYAGQVFDLRAVPTSQFDAIAGASVSVRAGGLAVMLSDGGLVATLALPLRGVAELAFDAAAATTAQVAASGAAGIGLVVAAHAAVAFEVVPPADLGPPPDWASLTTSLYGQGDYGVGLYSKILFDVEAPPWEVVSPPAVTSRWQVVGEDRPDWSGVTISLYGTGDYGRGLYSHIEDRPNWQTVYRPPTPVDRTVV
jgi:hypothetical protein